jgi:hypothetical protein
MEKRRNDDSTEALIHSFTGCIAYSIRIFAPLLRVKKPTILAISVNRVHHPNIAERPFHLPISGNMSPLLNLCSSQAPSRPQVPTRAQSATLPMHSAMSTAPSHRSSSKGKSLIRPHHRFQPMLPPVILIRNTRDVDPQLIIITTIPAALAIFPEPPVTSLADLYLTAVIRTALCAVVVHAAVAAQSVVVC